MQGIKDALLADYDVRQWMLVFFLYSIAGWVWEVAFCLAQEHRFTNRGFLSGPMLPIYGFGATAILLACVPLRSGVVGVALMGMAVASALECATGWLLEALFHVRYWDYSEYPLNIHGYVCLYASAIWAAFSVLVVCVIHPLCMPLIRRIPPMIALALCAGLTVFALGDAALSVRRALDLRALLEMLERAAQVMQEFDMESDARTALRARRADTVLRRNPRVVSKRHSAALAVLKGR